MTGKRLVLDTCVFLPMVAGDETLGKLRAKIIRECDSIALSEDLREEYINVLGREIGLSILAIWGETNAFQCRGKGTEAKYERLEIAKVIVKNSSWSEKVKAKDWKLFECAIACKCSYIVSRDNPHVLDLEEIELENFEGEHLKIAMLTPEEYLKLLEKS